MATVGNPFEPIHDALWDLFDANTALKELVKLGNRLKLNDKKTSPFKQQQVDSDFPQLIVVPSGGQFMPIVSSDGSELVQWFDIELSDSDLVITNKYFPLKWQIIKSLAKVDELLSLSYVKKVIVEDIIDLQKPPDEQAGWIGIMRVSVIMWFSRDDLKTIP